MGPAFAEEAMGTMHVAVDRGHDDRGVIPHGRKEGAERAVGRLDVGVIAGQFTAGHGGHLRVRGHVAPQDHLPRGTRRDAV